MESNPALQERFLAYQQIWQLSQAPVDAAWDTNHAWKRFSQHQDTGQLSESKNRTRKLSWAMAAALVLAFGAAVFLWSGPQVTEYAYDPTNNAPIELADGSVIYLNKEASVKVSSFKKKPFAPISYAFFI